MALLVLLVVAVVAVVVGLTEPLLAPVLMGLPVVLTAVAAAALEQAELAEVLVLSAQSASSGPVVRAPSHRQTQGTYKWQLFQASFLR